MIPFDVAYARIMAPLATGATETVALPDAHRRVLAETLQPRMPLPPFAQVEREGFALRAQDGRGASIKHPVELLLVGEASAGHPFFGPLRPGAAVRVMTGAPLPAGADTVMALDDADEDGDRVVLRQEPVVGTAVRAAGYDLCLETTVLSPGTWLTPALIQQAAAMGYARVKVVRRPRVAIWSNGDELVETGLRPGPGQIPESNGPGLMGRVMTAGGDPHWLGIVPDQRGAIEATLYRAIGEFDAVVSSGGVSQGRYDHVSEVMADLGEILAKDLAIYPGKSPVFAMIEGKPHFALPGNPTSAALGFELVVRPALLRMQGIMEPRGFSLEARLSEDVDPPRDRRSFLLARLRASEGSLWADLVPGHGASLVRSLGGAQALVVIPEGQGKVHAGSVVSIMTLGATRAAEGT